MVERVDNIDFYELHKGALVSYNDFRINVAIVFLRYELGSEAHLDPNLVFATVKQLPLEYTKRNVLKAVDFILTHSAEEIMSILKIDYSQYKKWKSIMEYLRDNLAVVACDAHSSNLDIDEEYLLGMLIK